MHYNALKIWSILSVNLLKYKKVKYNKNMIERLILNSNTLKCICMNEILETALLRWLFLLIYLIDIKPLAYIILFIDDETIN